MPARNTVKHILLSTLILLLAFGCGGKPEEKTEVPATPATDTASEAVRQDRVTDISEQIIHPEVIAETFTLPGSIEASEDIVVATEVAGPVRWIGPKEGARVTKGTPLLRVNTETLEAGLARSQAVYNLAQKNLTRIEELMKSRSVSRQSYDDALSSYKVAEADLTVAKTSLEKGTLKSPITGILNELMVDEGEYVNVGTNAAHLVSIDKLQINVDIPEKDITFLSAGQEVDVIPALVYSEDSEHYTGTISHLSYVADPASKTFRAKIIVDNKNERLRPGMIVRVRYIRRTFTDAVVIPLYALVSRDDQQVVFTNENGVAKMHKAVVKATIGSRVVLERGLKPGDKLIVKGQHLIADGDPVSTGE